ncbi:MAG TPA: response regulator, partial [Candidatus Caenarcaniphilales bacterium]|nr:response regulator [Candidatus Caenarcaniphilales bacterium]
LLDVVTDGRAVLDQIRELGPDVVIVDALLQGKVNGLEVAQTMREAGIDLPIIALTVPQKPIAVGSDMGVARVLPMPFSGFDFMNVLQEATARVNRYRVVLIDGSLQFADLRALLRIPPDAPSILQLPTDRIQRTDVDEIVYRDRAGIDILLAPPRVEMAEMINPRDIEKVVSLLPQVYNVVIIDTATSITDSLLAFLDASDVIVQVLTYELAALQQSRAIVDIFAAIGYRPEKVRYLVNRADATGGLAKDVIEQQMGRRPDFQVVSDGRLVLEANNRGEPFVIAAPEAPISGDVVRIAQSLSGSAAPATVARA